MSLKTQDRPAIIFLYQQSDEGAQEHSDTAVTGFVGAVYNRGEQQEWKLNIGNAYRFPSLTEHYYSGSTGRGTIVANSDLVPETSTTVELTLTDVYGDFAWQLAGYDSRVSDYIEHQTPVVPVKVQQKLSLVGLASLGFKLLKSAKVIKVVLAGASVAAYSRLFSFQFALALIACLMFHEYGHIRAMKYFGMKTKGIYLIPFMGGLALSDEKINTRWQDVVISIMGPTFGLLMSIASLVAYWLTDNPLFAGLAAFNALLNLFNLFPILPLDGGHILKSISFSMNSLMGLIACMAGAAIGVFISYSLGLALLGFLLLIGSLEIIFEWKTRHQSHLLPLDRYGQIFSAIWYLLTVGALVTIIWYLAGSGDDMLGLPLKILQS
ncbi:TonB-dependent receptor [Shewanella insulae]|uniref:site-2 protease family protein n=1 Tax=Shewanella insulae TaxID=2681496 RepID=UPI001EFC3985|nr:TonB-dependent receptor [Shewanella insulae]MCG9714730.1 TonB-dependent receptor [Shewanella insulae]